MNASGIKILSIGRFCYAKNFDNVPDICRQIRQNGLEVTWYLIGFGKNEKQIRKRICETGMKQYVKILGKKRIHIHISGRVMFMCSHQDMRGIV